jgi:predicted GNAT family N-acyltransferase
MDVKVSVVKTPEALAQAFAIRSVVYIGEQKCPYDEEFDGNDFCASHILAHVDGEPAGTVRMRWFGTFAKYERVAVLPKFRKGPTTRTMMEFAFDYQRRKGFTTGYAHSMKGLVPYWATYDFVPRDPAKVFVFSDHEYIEVFREFEPHPHAIKIANGPYVTLRLEGAWDEAGLLEESATRPATNIHGGKI